MKKQTIIAIILIIAAGLIGYGLGTQKEGNLNGNGQPTTKEPIKIGVSLPLTGEGASYGEAIIGGAQLAEKEINEAGGIKGREIKLIIEDTPLSGGAVSVINKLVNIDKITALVGPLSSASAGPTMPIAQNAGVSTIVIASAPDLTKTGDYIFRNYPSDALQGKFAADFIYNKLNKNKAAVIYVQNDWGQGIRNVFTEQFKTLGGEILYDEGVAQDIKDVKTVLSKVKAKNPDILYLPLYPATGIIALKQAKELGFEVPIIGGDSFAGDEVIQAPEAEGTLYTVAKMIEQQEFKNRIKAVSDKEINVYASYFYDAIKIFAKVMEKVGTDKQAVRDELAITSYKEGVSNPIIEFDAIGDLKSAEFEVRIIKGGKTEVFQDIRQ